MRLLLSSWESPPEGTPPGTLCPRTSQPGTHVGKPLTAVPPGPGVPPVVSIVRQTGRHLRQQCPERSHPETSAHLVTSVGTFFLGV